MVKINPTQINSIKAKGAKAMENTAKNIEDFSSEIIEKLHARAEREVPEYGSFKLVYEDFRNPDKNMQATDFMLKISKPKDLQNEKARVLEAVAYNLPSPYIVERVIASGNKADILTALKNPDLKTDLPQIFMELSKHLEDV